MALQDIQDRELEELDKEVAQQRQAPTGGGLLSQMGAGVVEGLVGTPLIPADLGAAVQGGKPPTQQAMEYMGFEPPQTATERVGRMATSIATPGGALRAARTLMGPARGAGLGGALAREAATATGIAGLTEIDPLTGTAAAALSPAAGAYLKGAWGRRMRGELSDQQFQQVVDNITSTGLAPHPAMILEPQSKAMARARTGKLITPSAYEKATQKLEGEIKMGLGRVLDKSGLTEGAAASTRAQATLSELREVAGAEFGQMRKALEQSGATIHGGALGRVYGKGRVQSLTDKAINKAVNDVGLDFEKPIPVDRLLDVKQYLSSITSFEEGAKLSQRERQQAVKRLDDLIKSKLPPPLRTQYETANRKYAIAATLDEMGSVKARELPPGEIATTPGFDLFKFSQEWLNTPVSDKMRLGGTFGTLTKDLDNISEGIERYKRNVQYGATSTEQASARRRFFLPAGIAGWALVTGAAGVAAGQGAAAITAGLGIGAATAGHKWAKKWSNAMANPKFTHVLAGAMQQPYDKTNWAVFVNRVGAIARQDPDVAEVHKKLDKLAPPPEQQEEEELLYR